MGRLDDAAKHKVVELRKAGLSFRKIKAVLELENIKVSAQAIYLFLREFQGRPPGRVRPVEVGCSTSSALVQARSGGVQGSWSNVHLQNLIRESSHHSGYLAMSDLAKQKSANVNTTKPCGSMEASSSSSRQGQGDKEEHDIQIVSVTSLAQRNQRGAPASVTKAATSVASSTGAITAALMRRRASPSPATASMLAARKRLLDKALSHRMKSFHQVASLLRRDQASVQGPDLRNTVQQPTETYDLSNGKTVMGSQPEVLGGASARRYSMQRPGLPIRSLHIPPRVGIRLPNQHPVPLATSSPGSSVLRLPNTHSCQGANQSEGNSSPQQTIQDSRIRGLLQDQVQALSSEVHTLGLAVKMLVEQQCHLEREQMQQTNIQKQILCTLQSISSKLGCCLSVQQQNNKTPSPSSLPATSESTSFNQDSFNCSQGTYTQCSQTQPSFNSLESLETVEAFKLPELSPPNMNGFATCSSAESLPLIHTPSQAQSYAALYQQQTHMPGFTPTYVSAYNQSSSQTFRGTESKVSDFSNSCAVRTLQDCSISTQPGVSLSDSVQEQVNIIKVEGP